MSTRPGGSSGGGPRRYGSSSSSSSGGPAGSGSTAPGGRPPRGGRGRRFFPPRRKVCAFCVDHVPMIDYKDAPKLRRYLSERARIEPRRKTGTCATHQRALAVAIKRARHLGLLPFVGTIGEHHRESRPPRDFAPRGYAPRPPMQQPMQPPAQPVAQPAEAPAQPPGQS